MEYKYPYSLMQSYSGSGHKVSLAEGDSVVLVCKPDSNPPAAVAWRREGTLGVWSDEEEVIIENVARENGGSYTCTGHNSLGVSAPKEIILDVKCT